MKDWIDRYLYAVGQKLPRLQREDIKKELRSIILDALDERIANQKLQKGEDYEATEEDVFAVLESFGSPDEVAAKYKPSNRYLIGPELHELYCLLLYIVLGAVVLGISIATTIDIIYSQDPFIEQLLKLPMNLISAAVNAVGTVTIIFAIIQRFGKEERIKGIDLNKNWNPRNLEPVPVAHEVIKVPDTIAAICLIIIALIIFNKFPHIIAMYNVSKGTTSVTPIFNLDVLAGYMKYMNILWIGAVLLNIYKLMIGKWNTFLRLIEIVIDMGVLIIVLMMTGNPAILNPSIKDAVAGTDMEFLMKLGGIGSVSFRIFIAVIFLFTVFEAGKHIYYSIKSH